MRTGSTPKATRPETRSSNGEGQAVVDVADTADGSGGGASLRHAHCSVAAIPSHHPGRCSTRSGRRSASRSASRNSASISSSYARTWRPPTGDAARYRRPGTDSTTAPASHRHVTATPAVNQPDTPSSRGRVRCPPRPPRPRRNPPAAPGGSHRDAGDVGLGHAHLFRVTPRTDRTRDPTRTSGRAGGRRGGRVRPHGRAGRGTAIDRLRRAGRPSAYHGRTPRQGCSLRASLRDGRKRPPLSGEPRRPWPDAVRRRGEASRRPEGPDRPATPPGGGHHDRSGAGTGRTPAARAAPPSRAPRGPR